MNPYNFHIGQRFVVSDGTKYGEVIEITDEGLSGVVRITDENDNILDSYRGTCAAFVQPGYWTSVVGT